MKLLLCCGVIAISLFYLVIVSALELASETDAPETNSTWSEKGN